MGRCFSRLKQWRDLATRYAKRAAKARISQSTASQFIAVLQRARLVESTRIGQWTYYRRNGGRIATLPELLKTSL